MSEFKVIETQEQFDEQIKERLARARESERKAIEEKYKDYEELRTKAESLTAQVDDLTKSLGDATASLEEFKTNAQSSDERIAELEATIAKNERDSVKTKVAYKYGIPYEFAGRLSGETEEAIEEDAKNIAKYMVSSPGAVKKDPEPAPLDGVAEAFYKKNPNLKK